MAVLLVVRAQANANIRKGDIARVWPVDTVLSSAYDLPDYVQITVPDADEANVEAYLASVRDILQWELLAENAEGRRYRLYIHPKVLTQGGTFRQQIKDYFLNELNATVVSSDLPNGEVTLDVPTTDWAAAKTFIDLELQNVVAKRRYKISNAAVNAAINAGGKVTVGKANVLQSIVDRLA